MSRVTGDGQETHHEDVTVAASGCTGKIRSSQRAIFWSISAAKRTAIVGAHEVHATALPALPNSAGGSDNRSYRYRLPRGPFLTAEFLCELQRGVAPNLQSRMALVRLKRSP